MLELNKGDRAPVQTEIPSSNFIISRRSCVGTAKKCTKKRDARAELLFCSLNSLLFDVPVAVTVVVS